MIMSRCPKGYDDDDCAMFKCSTECAIEYRKLYDLDDKEEGVMPEEIRVDVGAVKNVEQRFWRTDLRVGRNIYVLLSNDPEEPSDMDPLIGVMEKTALAEDVVNAHNGLLERYGRKYPERIAMEKRDE